MKIYKCPCCDSNLDFESWDINDQASFEICPICKIQFGNDDFADGDKKRRRIIYRKWHDTWLENKKQKLSKEQIEIIKSN